jgi:hypothetical protein
MKVLLSSACWPNLHYLWYVLNASSVTIDEQEFYVKQSYRNRCTILSANGSLNLSIPVRREHHKCTTGSVLISRETSWPQQHWHAIRSAYGKSPYFEYFAPDIATLYETPYERLVDLNRAQLALILKLLRLKKDIVYASSFVETTEDLDLRSQLHPKHSFKEDARIQQMLTMPYYQTFGAKFEFVPNLSILDLLFNTGLESRHYLLRPSEL